MTSRCSSIAITIAKCGKKHHKFYSFPTQKKILDLLASYHDIKISERTLRRDLTWLVDNLFIEKIQRTRKDDKGHLVWTSNLYKFKHKFFMWLRSLEVLTSNLFSFFRRPKLADNQLKQKQASSLDAPTSVQKLLIKERDGTILHYDPRNGGLSYPSGVPY